MKDLLTTSKNMSRTVIVDNNPFSFLLQPSNGIPCIAFSAGQPNDTQVSITLLLFSLYICLLLVLKLIRTIVKLEAFGRYSTTSEATFRGRRCKTDTL